MRNKYDPKANNQNTRKNREDRELSEKNDKGRTICH